MNFSADTWWLFGLIVSAVLAIISFFLKRTITQVDDHDKSINEIKRTYVTKGELKDFKEDVNHSIGKIQADVEQIKDTCLTKKDFINQQNKIETKIDKLYELFLEQLKEGKK